MKKAYVFVRHEPHYRREAFVGGLKKLGYDVQSNTLGRVQPGDVMLTWNRYWDRDQLAKQVERQGGLVIVAENGYLGHDAQGRQLYSLACHGHNGSGWWPEGGPERFDALRVDLRPWRAQGSFIYIRGQRGIGSPQMASPMDWHKNAARVLAKYTAMRTVVVEHPGKPACDLAAQLASSLAGAHCCVIWSSAVGVQALVNGIPVVYDAPHWICAPAAKRGLANINEPLMDDAARLSALRRMAWAQWTVDEIATGDPFARLVECNEAQRGPEKAVVA